MAHALADVIDGYETRIVALVSMLMGYLCILLTKVFRSTDILMGVAAVAFITLLLLSLHSNRSFTSMEWWWRAFVVIVVCLVVTAPQLHFAWTVSANEAQDAAEALQNRKLIEAGRRFITPNVNISPPQSSTPGGQR
jgi:phosphoglycerol transferase MdoB-like AlkP superfamily enzyme